MPAFAMSTSKTNEAPRGLTLQARADGHWLTFKTNGGKTATLYLEQLGRGPVVKEIMMQWAAEQLAKVPTDDVVETGQYRLLEMGEQFRRGDEVRWDGVWKPVEHWEMSWVTNTIARYRRKLPACAV